ncbi:Uncharacterised protein (plasmid) [Tsukamurella tyrosinosolvens]|uniref:Uncharacterized protein n=1 Tax=Tsukamurella tyrosinosolvens TaxID=57704 RepID=A0A1H4V0M4_TSUTY|nr:hypothetical protein [Tsukamurella tyrosinosolvens]SEC74526.1 hypothetical protein SAMN04489793_3101 [Tsukamurella tyrosinosolvens]VEH90759.1 Uncharacterised protein [Tsukamurella tyrosinosolvens]
MGRARRLRLTVEIEAGLREGFGSPRGAYLRVGRTRIQLRERRSTEKSSRPYWRRPGDRDLSVESRLPLPWSLMLQLNEKQRTYSEVVGYTGPGIDYLLDMFDPNFNALAAATLRYHLHLSVSPFQGEVRDQMQGLHDRLLEPRPRLAATDEDRETLALVNPYCTEYDPLGWDIAANIQKRRDAMHDRY